MMLDDFMTRATLAGVGVALAAAPLGLLRGLAAHGLFRRRHRPCRDPRRGAVAGLQMSVFAGAWPWRWPWR
jgi:hypothetical protein